MKERMIAVLCVLAVLLVLAVVILLVAKFTKDETADEPLAALKGKYFSIFGDSISTMQNVSDGAAFVTTNSTLPLASWHYKQDGERQGVTRADTWWQQAADQLGLQLLVNNSWSGSLLMMPSHTANSEAGYLNRPVQLHADKGDFAGTDPDIIAFFMGTNDFIRQDVEGFMVPIGTYGQTAEKLDAGKLWTLENGAYTYAQPETTLDAYAISLHKISIRYPDAEVYCFTLIRSREDAEFEPAAFNEDIVKLVDRFGYFVTDLYDCGFQAPMQAHQQLSGDGLHPNKAGMDAITAAFVSSVLENSRYVAADAKKCSVTYDLKGVVTLSGAPKTVLLGQPLELELATFSGSKDYMAVVTMGGQELSVSCYSDGKITIPAVTGDLLISVKADCA